MQYVRIAETAELAPGQMKGFQVEGFEVLLANIGGEFYAMADRCPHQAGSLCKGALQSAVVQCPRHGARFDVKTGRALSGARRWFFREHVEDAVSFPVLVDGSRIYVGLPEPR